MKYIIIGTNRRNSRSSQVGVLLQNLYRELGEEVGLIQLADLPFQDLTGEQYGQPLLGAWAEAQRKIESSEGLIFVVPEYNGSFPGAMKYFIDHWKYPDAFEHRPVAFVGLGGLFGGLRPVEHLQQVMGYRNAFIFPQRIFLQNVWNSLKEGEIKEPQTLALLKRQCRDFQGFVKAIKGSGLHAEALAQERAQKAPSV